MTLQPMKQDHKCEQDQEIKKDQKWEIKRNNKLKTILPRNLWSEVFLPQEPLCESSTTEDPFRSLPAGILMNIVLCCSPEDWRSLASVSHSVSHLYGNYSSQRRYLLENLESCVQGRDYCHRIHGKLYGSAEISVNDFTASERASGIYICDQRHGPWIINNDNGCYIKERYWRGQIHGVRKSYAASGKILEEETYVHGLRHGPYRKYLLYLDVRWVPVKGGSRTDNGEPSLAEEGTYSLGRLEGWKRRYAYGNLVEESYYHEGLLDGMCRIWDSLSDSFRELEYSRGKPVIIPLSSPVPIEKPIIESPTVIPGPKSFYEVEKLFSQKIPQGMRRRKPPKIHGF